jgi:hypothetical protein
MPPARLSRPDDTVDRGVLTLIDAQHARRAWHRAPLRLHRAGHRQARSCLKPRLEEVTQISELVPLIRWTGWGGVSIQLCKPRLTAHRVATSIALRRCCARRFAHRRGRSRLKRLFVVERAATISCVLYKNNICCGQLSYGQLGWRQAGLTELMNLRASRHLTDACRYSRRGPSAPLVENSLSPISDVYLR